MSDGVGAVAEFNICAMPQQIASGPSVQTIRAHCVSSDNHQNRADVKVPVTVIGPPPRNPSLSPVSRENDRLNSLRKRCRDIVARFRNEPLTADAPNWARFHALAIHGSSGSARSGGLRNQLHDIILDGRSANFPPFTHDANRLSAVTDGPLLQRQHHKDQFLHLMAMGGVALNAQLLLREGSFTVSDLLEASLREVTVRGEHSWTVPAYTTYLAPGRKWSNKYGEQLSLQRLSEVLLTEKSEACGGTHRLFAIAKVVDAGRRHKQIVSDDLLARLSKELDSSAAELATEQHESGSFRLPHYLAEAYETANPRHPWLPGIHYTGHSLEWLSIVATND